MRADYHFHPNLPRHEVSARKKARRIWEAFESQKLDVVLVTEHSYKDPERAFRILQETRGDHATIIFPGAECISAEGVDLIVFAEHASAIYSQKELLTPYRLTLTAMVERVASQEGLFGIVVHPHTPGTTSIVRICGREVAIDAIRKLGFLEKHNGSLVTLERFLRKTGLRHVFATVYRSAKETVTTPAYFQEHARVLTVGSDAHAPEDVGWASILPDEGGLAPGSVFKALLGASGAAMPGPERPFWTLVPTGLETFSEFLDKKRYTSRPAS